MGHSVRHGISVAPESIQTEGQRVATVLEWAAGQGTLFLLRLTVSWVVWVRMRKYMECHKPSTGLPLVPPWRKQFSEPQVLGLENHAGRAGVINCDSWAALL